MRLFFLCFNGYLYVSLTIEVVDSVSMTHESRSDTDSVASFDHDTS